VNFDAVMIGELQGDVRSVLEVLWRDWFGINPTAGAGLLERAHSVVLLAMIVAAAVGVGGVLARAVLVRRAGDRPCARRLLRIAVAAAVVLAAVIWRCRPVRLPPACSSFPWVAPILRRWRTSPPRPVTPEGGHWWGW